MSQAPIASFYNCDMKNNQLNMTCPERFNYRMEQSFSSNNDIVQNSSFHFNKSTVIIEENSCGIV